MKQRMPNLLLVGPTNNGKSMIIEKFHRAHPPSSSDDEEQVPVLAVQMPSDPSVSRFYAGLLSALGAPLRPRQQVAELEHLALRLLRRVGVRMLVIDELHNVLAGRDASRREFLNLLRFLGNELRIPLVGVGTREAYLAIRSDDQLENRFEPITLPLWAEGSDTLSLLASFAALPPAEPVADRNRRGRQVSAGSQRGNDRRTDTTAHRSRGRRGGQRRGGDQPPHPEPRRLHRPK